MVPFVVGFAPEPCECPFDGAAPEVRLRPDNPLSTLRLQNHRLIYTFIYCRNE